MPRGNSSPGYVRKLRLIMVIVALICCISFVNAALIRTPDLKTPTHTEAVASITTDNASLPGSATGSSMISADSATNNADKLAEQFSGIALYNRITELENRLDDAQTTIDELKLSNDNLKKMNDALKLTVDNLQKSNDNVKTSYDQIKDQISQIETKLSDHIDETAPNPETEAYNGPPPPQATGGTSADTYKSPATPGGSDE